MQKNDKKEHFNLYYIFLEDKNNNQMSKEKAEILAKSLKFTLIKKRLN